jgi:hypothetical protein
VRKSKTHRSRKKLVKIAGAVLLLILVIAGVGAALLRHHHVSANPIRSVPGLCRVYTRGLYDSFGPDGFRELANNSGVVVAGSITNVSRLQTSVNGARPTAAVVHVEQVLTGSGITRGQTTKLCPGLIPKPLTVTGNSIPIFLFIEARDGQYWVPTEGDFGIGLPGKGGRIKPVWIRTAPYSVNVDELQQLVR